MITHELIVNLEKDGLRNTISRLLDCFREDEDGEHEYLLNILDLHEEDDEEDDNVFKFDNFPEAVKFLIPINKALRKGYELGLKEGGKNE